MQFVSISLPENLNNNLLYCDGWNNTIFIYLQDGFEYLKPIDSVGSCYTTSVSGLRLAKLPPRRKTKPSITCLDADGNLTYPPKLPRLQPQRPTKSAAQRHQPGVVKLSVNNNL